MHMIVVILIGKNCVTSVSSNRRLDDLNAFPLPRNADQNIMSILLKAL